MGAAGTERLSNLSDGGRDLPRGMGKRHGADDHHHGNCSDCSGTRCHGFYLGSRLLQNCAYYAIGAPPVLIASPATAVEMELYRRVSLSEKSGLMKAGFDSCNDRLRSYCSRVETSISASSFSIPTLRCFVPYSKPLSKALRFSSRKAPGTESATASRSASGCRTLVTAAKNPTITMLSTMRWPISSARRVAGTP